MIELSTLGEHLKKNPRSMDDRAVLQSILGDIFPQDKRKVNLLLMGFDEDIFSLVGTNPTCERLSKLVRTIMDNYGVGEESAVYIIETWLGEVFHEPLPKGFGSHVSSASEPSSSSSSALSVDDVWGIFSNTHRVLMQEYGIMRSKDMEELVRNSMKQSRIECSEVMDESVRNLMKQNGIECSEDMGKWDIVRNDNPYRPLHPEYKHYSRIPFQREKSLILRKLGKGRYQEKDFVYIRSSEDMSQSWGITYDSLIIFHVADAVKTRVLPLAAASEKLNIPHVADFVIPFVEIDNVDPDYGDSGTHSMWGYERIQAIQVTLRNGKSYILEPSDMMAREEELFPFYNFLKIIKDMV